MKRRTFIVSLIGSMVAAQRVLAEATPEVPDQPFAGEDVVRVLNSEAVKRSDDMSQEWTFLAIQFTDAVVANRAVPQMAAYYADWVVQRRIERSQVVPISLGEIGRPYQAAYDSVLGAGAVIVTVDSNALVLLLDMDPVEPIATVATFLQSFLPTYDQTVDSLIPDVQELPIGWSLRFNSPQDITAAATGSWDDPSATPIDNN